MNTSSYASTERRNPMPKPFTTIVPSSFRVASETYQFSPAVRIGDQILISGIVGSTPRGYCCASASELLPGPKNRGALRSE